MNMMKIRVIFVRDDSPEVRPVERPVVPKADETSKNISSNLTVDSSCPPYSFSDETITRVPTNTRMNDPSITANALVTVSFGILLLNTLTCVLPLILDHRPRTMIASVVVLIPPAVDDGAEPMNISIEYRKWVPGENSPIGIEAKPALRVDIVLNIIDITLSPFVPGPFSQNPPCRGTSKAKADERPINAINA